MGRIKQLVENKNNTPIQFLKYAFAGVLAAVTHILTFTVLNETEMVDGIETRVIEEREFDDGELIEVSRNFVA